MNTGASRLLPCTVTSVKRATLSAAKRNGSAWRSAWQTSVMEDEGRRPLGELSFQLEKDAAVLRLRPGCLKRMWRI